MTAAAPTRWLRRRVPRPAARCRVVIFPHAGGTANAYWSWAAQFPADIEVWTVQYPGRENRASEPLVDAMGPLADAIAAAVADQADAWSATGAVTAGGDGAGPMPLVLFGHSMGASVAYETTRRLRERRPGLVRLLAVSARAAPTTARPGQVHELGREAFLDVLRRQGGTDATIFAHEELLDYVLPIIRSDYRLIETYQPPRDFHVPVDIVAFAGADDATVQVADVRSWADVTTTAFDHRVFPGGHFYLWEHAAQVVGELVRRIRHASPPETPAEQAPASQAPGPGLVGRGGR